MPVIALEIKASLANITDLRPETYEDHRWYLKLKCSSCGEVSTNWQYATVDEFQELSKGHGIAHIVTKCGLCGRTNSLAILPDTYKSYSIEKNEEFQPIVKFECRGLEPVDFDPRVGWYAKGAETNTVFNNIDLNTKEWYDYDESSESSVEVTNMECRFVLSKSK